MRIEIVTKKCQLDDFLRELIEKKLNKFDKYFSKEASAKVKIYLTGNDAFTIEISVSADNMSEVRAIGTSNKLNETIDTVLPKLERQIVKYRDKFGTKLKKSALEEAPIYSENTNLKSKNGKIVKIKKFDISVTSIDNALEEMEMLSHNFYVFVNGDNNKVSVLYKRNDGDYGLIEPEY